MLRPGIVCCGKEEYSTTVSWASKTAGVKGDGNSRIGFQNLVAFRRVRVEYGWRVMVLVEGLSVR